MPGMREVRTDQPHSKKVSEMEAAHISPELPIRWVVSADRTVEIKEEVTELGCDQANERILQEETPPSSITEREESSGLEHVHVKEESPGLEHVHVKEESPVLEHVHVKEEAPGLEHVHVKEESPVLEPVHVKEESPGLEHVHVKEEAPGLEHVHVKEESPVLEHVHVKEESPGLEHVHVKEESPVLEHVHVKEESPVLEPVHVKEESPVLESAECEDHLSDPKESRAIPKSEAQEGPRIEAAYKQEESFDQEWCASLKQVTELTCVKDEEVPRLECVPIKEEFIEQECVPIEEEVPTENNVCTLEENNKLGSSLRDDCPPECELGFRGMHAPPDHTPARQHTVVM
ncbi:UNVERIFIED_CONTAM: hypothetical protein FKN15_066311 [Acipenser sinensis]